jgi:transcriptional regulator with XRE-family HTH domain
MTGTTNVVTIRCMTLGSNLRKFRQDAELTQEQLAELSGVDQQVISAIETRNSKSSVYAPALAKALGKALDELVGSAPSLEILPSREKAVASVDDAIELLVLFEAASIEGRKTILDTARAAAESANGLWRRTANKR